MKSLYLILFHFIASVFYLEKVFQDLKEEVLLSMF